MRRVLTLDNKINLKGLLEKKGFYLGPVIHIEVALDLIWRLNGIPLSHFLDAYPKQWRRR